MCLERHTCSLRCPHPPPPDPPSASSAAGGGWSSPGRPDPARRPPRLWSVSGRPPSRTLRPWGGDSGAGPGRPPAAPAGCGLPVRLPAPTPWGHLWPGQPA
ncbi:MAG: hypothetical protein MZU95_16175 [Desulfomicrobium escambiense]|nr:hypothetical protein [Desulfomicrobium escambiense]